MAETKDVTLTKGVIAKAGEPERGEFKNQQTQQQSTDNGAGTMAAPIVPAAAAIETPEQKTARETAEAAAAKAKLPDLTDDQLKEIFAKKGIEGFDGNFASLKEKIAKADKPADVPPTDEEKKAADAAFEKRMLDHHITSGGTAEQFVALKQIAAMDLKELSVAEIKKEMKENGFDGAEIEVVLKERYYQLNADELQQGEEESDEDFDKRKKLTQKKVTYGSKKLEARSTHTQNNAKGILTGLRESIKAEDAARQKENQFSSKVDEHSRALSRKITFELGEVDKTKLDPISYDVSEADVAEVVAILKNPETRQQYFFNEDSTLNLTKVMDVMLRNKYLESAVKAALIEGGNRQVAAFKKVFPDSPFAVGVGGSQAGSQGRKGVIAKAGQPEVAVPQR